MKDHPFYCYKKKCRKTAWDTPEYLNQSNWDDLKNVIEWIEKGDSYKFWLFVSTRGDRAQNFFNKVVGWPEGYNYCQEVSYCEKTALPMFAKHDLAWMKNALTLNQNKDSI